MNKLSLIALVLLCAGCAGQAPRSDEPNRLAASPFCLHDTGSRIAPAEGECMPAVGHSYSRDDVERTGQSTTGNVLRSLTLF